MNQDPRVVIAGGDHATLSARADLLETAGWHVVDATTLEEALELVRDASQDLLLVDVPLPDGGARETIENIRAYPTGQRPLLVLLLQRGARSEERTEALQAGADDVIIKPIADRQLLTRLEALHRVRRETESHYRELFDDAPIGIYRTTPDGEIVSANPALVRMLGYDSFEDLAERDLESQGFDPDYPRPTFKYLMEDLGRVRGLRSGWRRKDGSTLFVRENAEPIYDDGGGLVAYQGTVEDVTEDVHRARRIGRLERLNTLLDAISEVDQLIVREDDRESLIQGACSLLVQTQGYCTAWIALLDQDGSPSHVAQAGLEGHLPALLRALEDDTANLCGVQVLSEPGLWVSPAPQDCTLGDVDDGHTIMAARLQHGGVAYGLITVSLPFSIEPDQREQSLFSEVANDIAFALHNVELEERRAETDRALRESEHRQSLILNSTREMFAYHNKDLEIQWANQAAADSLGVSVEELIGRHCYEAWAQRSEPCDDCPVLAALRTGEPQEAEQTTPDGRSWFLRGYPVLNEEGEIEGLVEFGQDITARKQAEKAQEAAHQQLLTVLNGLDAHIYAADMETYDVLFMNKKMRDDFGGDATGDKCFEVFHHRSSPCPRCTNSRLVDHEGNPTAVYVWEGRNPVTGRWYVNRDRAIRWVDGRLARLEIATDTTDRKRAQEALQESQRRLTTLMSNLPGMAYRCQNDPEWTMEFVSEGCRPLTGYPRQDLTNNRRLSYADLILPDDREMVWNTIQEKLATREPFQLVYRIRTADGDERWVWEQGRGVFGDGGEVTALEGFITDITERKRAEEALRESEALLNRSQAIANVGSWEYDTAADQLTWSEQVYHILGVDHQAFGPSYDSFLELIHPDDRQRVDSAYSESLRDGSTGYEIEHRVIRTDNGEVRYVHEKCEHVRDETGQVVRSVGMVQDITDRRRAQEAVRRSERRYRTLFDSSLDGIAASDLDGNVLDCNQAYLDLTGHSLEEMRQLRYQDLTPETWREVDAVHVKQALERGYSEIYEKERIRKDGTVFPISIRIWARKDEQGDPIGLWGIVRDISERKEAENALQRQIEAVEASIDGIAILNAREEYVHVNQAHAQIYGYDDPEALVGKTWRMLYEDDELARFEDQIMPRLARDGRWRGEAVGKRKDGSTFPQEVSLTALDDGGLVCIVRDITGRRQVEEDLRRSLEEEARSQRLLLALSQAAQSVQRARTPEEVYRTIGDEISALGYQAAIFTVTEDRAHMAAAHLTLKPTVVKKAEKLTGLSAENYRYPLREGGFYERIVEEGKPVFSDPAGIPLAEALPKPVRPLAGTVARVLGLEQAIYAPLVIDGETHAMLAVIGENLVEDDVPAVTAFASQAAIAVQNARLYEETQRLAAFNETIVQSMAEGIIVEDEDGVIGFANPAAADMLGYRPQEMVGMDRQTIIAPGQNVIVKQTNGKRRRGEADRYELDFVRKDGDRIAALVSGTPRFDADGSFIGTIAAITDITSRKQAEEERERLAAQVREQARELEQILVSVPAGVLLLDGERRVVQANPVARRDLTVLCDSGVGEILHRLGDRPLEELLTSPPKGLWHEVTSDEGTFEVIARPMAHGGDRQSWVVVINDVTDEREVRLQLRQQERLAAVGQLAGGIAHDFNNILASIILYAQMPLGRSDVSSLTKDALETILTESRRAADLVQQVLDFSRSAMMDTEPISLVGLVKEAFSLLRRTILYNDPATTEMDVHPCTVEADATRIHQVLMNLALNAKDAMPQGGTLRIGVGRLVTTGDGQPPLPDMPPGTWASLTVADTGTGMTEEAQEHLFEPFFTTKEQGKGTGLGLAQVYGIVKQHRGFIDVETAIGEGTTVTIYLPLAEKEEVSEIGDQREAALQGLGETILVVEDAEQLRRAIQTALESLGYTVVTAANGRQALEALGEEEVDLVLTDVVMPHMGGEALLRALRTEDADVKSIAMTGHVMDTDLQRLRATGFAEALPKPFSIEELTQVVREVLDR